MVNNRYALRYNVTEKNYILFKFMKETNNY